MANKNKDTNYQDDAEFNITISSTNLKNQVIYSVNLFQLLSNSLGKKKYKKTKKISAVDQLNNETWDAAKINTLRAAVKV
jgi:hypothetical protein